jgi:hypothetical protein
LEAFEVQLGAVTFVLAKLVTGVAYVHFHHDPVAGDFCYDAGRGDAETF